VAVLGSARSQKSNDRTTHAAIQHRPIHLAKVRPSPVVKPPATSSRQRSHAGHRRPVPRRARAGAAGDHVTASSPSASGSSAATVETSAATSSSRPAQSAPTSASASQTPHYTSSPTPTRTRSSSSAQRASGSSKTPAYGASGALAPGSSPNG
jgi:hypothetical protein